jgi:PRTRC genetic system protein C
MIKVEVLQRCFRYQGVVLPDPDPNMSVEQVRDMYVATYPELATAAVEGPSPVDARMEYTFTRAVGAKG